MVAVPSTMLPLGTPLPDFALTDAVSGTRVTSRDFDGAKAVLVMFICNHCPFVQHVKSELGRVARDYQGKGLTVVAINANDLGAHPEDGPDYMEALAREEGWAFPFLFDATQEVAKAFRAACTPDFFVFDRDHRLVYRGQLDDSRPGNAIPVTGADLRVALGAALAGTPAPAEQKASIGCNIKWVPGREPDYFKP
jgi:peroxiredoxin